MTQRGEESEHTRTMAAFVVTQMAALMITIALIAFIHAIVIVVGVEAGEAEGCAAVAHVPLCAKFFIRHSPSWATSTSVVNHLCDALTELKPGQAEALCTFSVPR